MTATTPALDLASLDFSKPVAGIDEIRKNNPQRHEFEMLSAIVHIDPVKHLIVGYKDVTPNDFWVRGHMPGFPLMPGVLMCEAAAQLCGFYYTHQKIGDPGELLGLAGIDETRFVRQVRPGERLVMVGTGVKINRRLTKFRVVGTVNADKVFEALVSGVPIGKLEELRGA
jgi:3-hydroxyacyl-[acyl-carrier-protein] dehydratase